MTFEGFDDPDEQQEYNEQYLATLEKLTGAIKDDDDREAMTGAIQKHNVIRTGDPIQDAQHNYLLGKMELDYQTENLEPAVKEYIRDHDRIHGEGAGLRRYRKVMKGDQDNASVTDMLGRQSISKGGR